MSYKPHKGLRYQLARPGQIRGGRTADIGDLPGGLATILLAPTDCDARLPAQFTRLAGHQIVHGLWRQRWTDDGRASRPARGLCLAVSRWERVPGDWLPSGHIVYGVEEQGSVIWLIDEDACTQQLANDMNDLLLRLVGDGLWVQSWFGHRPALPAEDLTPLLAPLVLA